MNGVQLLIYHIRCVVPVYGHAQSHSLPGRKACRTHGHPTTPVKLHNSCFGACIGIGNIWHTRRIYHNRRWFTAGRHSACRDAIAAHGSPGTAIVLHHAQLAVEIIEGRV